MSRFFRALRLKHIAIALGASIAISLLLLYWCNRTVITSAEGLLYDSAESIPYRRVAIVLGTSKYIGNGWQNWYFHNRIEAAEKLYKAGKCSYLILSGDNHVKGYNEPQDMREELMKRGIPDSVLYLDYAGFRTYDSMVRCKAIFEQDSCIVVSQRFHNERALYIAQSLGIQAIGFNAQDIDDHNGFRTKFRERFARVLVVADIYFGRHPKFYGDVVPIGIPQVKAEE